MRYFCFFTTTKIKFELIVLTNFSYLVKNSLEFDVFEFDEIFFTNKKQFFKANHFRIRNSICTKTTNKG